jgi:outer membrane lipase/esterase
MDKRKRWGRTAGLAMLIAASLAACGGGNDPLPPKASISRVFVMGDSLADVGTFGGVKFTIQDPVNPGNSLIWPQIVASNFGLNGLAQCNFYTYTGSTFAANSTAGCTNYAIGDGRIFNGNPSNPQTIGTQMATRSASGNYNSTDLVLIDGGGNDAADLSTAFLEAAADPNDTAGKVTAFQNFLGQQLTPQTLTTLLGQDATGATAGVAYMQTLADTFYAVISSNVLARQANKVAILNIPDITITPRFQAVLASMGTAQATQVQTLIRTWISTFNGQLKARIGSDSRIALVDFYGDFQNEIANPVNYSLSNVDTPSCTTTVGTLGNFPCLSTTLDTSPPIGKTAGWWKNYAFSDGFHPTPYGHQLLAASVSRALARAGWL